MGCYEDTVGWKSIENGYTVSNLVLTSIGGFVGTNVATCDSEVTDSWGNTDRDDALFNWVVNSQLDTNSGLVRTTEGTYFRIKYCETGKFKEDSTTCTDWSNPTCDANEMKMPGTYVSDVRCVVKCSENPQDSDYEGCHRCGAGWSDTISGQTISNLVLDEAEAISLYSTSCGPVYWGDASIGNMLVTWDETTTLAAGLMRVQEGDYYRIKEAGCTCTNGIPDTDCSVEENKCTSCDDGYYLDGTSCVAWGGTCANGQLVTDQTERTANDQCGSCLDNYYLDSTVCNAMCTLMDLSLCTGTSDSGTYTGVLKLNPGHCTGSSCTGIDKTTCCKVDHSPVWDGDTSAETTASTTDEYVDTAGTCTDLEGSTTVDLSGHVNMRSPGKYVLSYECTDSFGHSSTLHKEVTVKRAILNNAQKQGNGNTKWSRMSVEDRTRSQEGNILVDAHITNSVNGRLNLNQNGDSETVTKQQLKSIILSVDDGMQLKYTLGSKSRTVLGRNTVRTKVEAMSEKIVRTVRNEVIEVMPALDLDNPSDTDTICYDFGSQDICCTFVSSTVASKQPVECEFSVSIGFTDSDSSVDSPTRRLTDGTCDASTYPLEQHTNCCFSAIQMEYDEDTDTYTFGGEFHTSKFCAVSETGVSQYSATICELHKLSSGGLSNMIEWDLDDPTYVTNCNYCQPGWSGENCETYTSTCTENPCGEHGTCTDDTYGSYECVCNSGYTGENCDTNVDDCAITNPCSGNGQCIDGISAYSCDCDSGWTGSACSIVLEGCPHHQYMDGTSCVPCPSTTQGYTTHVARTSVSSCYDCSTFAEFYQSIGCCSDKIKHPACTGSVCNTC
jgi:hypothetical protein